MQTTTIKAIYKFYKMQYNKEACMQNWTNTIRKFSGEEAFSLLPSLYYSKKILF